MSVTVTLPDEVANRLSAEARRRGQGVDEVATQLLNDGLDRGADPLETFIGSGRSERDDLGRRHRDLRAETQAGTTACDV